MKYLALGDSYTIGELVDEKDNFPRQLTELLQRSGFEDLQRPEIIAKTGWTAEELFQAIAAEHSTFENDFDLVTLLIGVNDQYRGYSVEKYEQYFLKLLLRAILFAKGQSRRVFVASIPDWGLTPFAMKEGRSKEKVAQEIDTYNKRNKVLTLAYRCHYLDITTLSRRQGEEPEKYLTSDKLHYSGAAYQEWAGKFAQIIQETLPE